jgi:hypothetical protein
MAADERLQVLEDAREAHVVVARHDGVERTLHAFAVGEEIERQEQCCHGPPERRHDPARVAYQIVLDAGERLLQTRILHRTGEWGRELVLLEQGDHLVAVLRGVAHDLGELLDERRNGQKNQE